MAKFDFDVRTPVAAVAAAIRTVFTTKEGNLAADLLQMQRRLISYSTWSCAIAYIGRARQYCGGMRLP